MQDKHLRELLLSEYNGIRKSWRFGMSEILNENTYWISLSTNSQQIIKIDEFFVKRIIEDQKHKFLHVYISIYNFIFY